MLVSRFGANERNCTYTKWYMTAAIVLVLMAHRSQASDLLDQAMAQPSDLIRAQITTQGRYLADGYEFIDEFQTDKLGLRKSRMSALEVLISQGASAVPYLVSQLGSQEPTKLRIMGDANAKVVAYESYDPKVRQPETDYWDVVTMEQVQKAEPYVHTVTRGDLAYFALGQITNRWYGILFPGKITLFCSASDHPEIQKQAAADWAGTTGVILQSSLRDDVKKPDTYARMVYGFTRYRCYYSGESVPLAVEALRNTYGRWPIGKPDVTPRSFFSELQPVASWEIDQIAYKWLGQTDKENGFLGEYDTTKYNIALYLKDRPRYFDITLKLVKDMLKKKQDKYGYYAQFVRRYDKK